MLAYSHRLQVCGNLLGVARVLTERAPPSLCMQVACVLGRLCNDLLDVPPIRAEIDRCVLRLGCAGVEGRVAVAHLLSHAFGWMLQVHMQPVQTHTQT